MVALDGHMRVKPSSKAVPLGPGKSVVVRCHCELCIYAYRMFRGGDLCRRRVEEEEGA